MSQRLPNSHSGVYYFLQGWSLIKLPGIRRFVLFPLLINILIMFSGFYWLFSKLGQWINVVMSYVPGWLQWLDYLIWPIAVLSILFIFTYFFSTVTNIIAAPFNGLLAEQLEARLSGKRPPETSIIRDIPRIMKREWIKLVYYIPRAAVILLLYLIPGLGQTLIPVLWFIFSAWMITIQYCDYPFDNHKVDFYEMKRSLKQYRVDSLQFGALVYLFTLVPILNLVIMPVAVCGATAMWVDRYQARLANEE
jgi:CysZ protein